MAIAFYHVSGSPFSWKVWLALERKQLPYESHLLSADKGDLKSPEFLRLNPRGKVPVIIDGTLVLRESGVIVDYLDERDATSGNALWPESAEERARARLMATEADVFIYPNVRKLVLELNRKEGEPDITAIAEAHAALTRELGLLDVLPRTPFFYGSEPTAADFSLYPFLALLSRVGSRRPEFNLSNAIPPGLAAWMREIEALPCFSKTIPPHWRAS
jgi:glutathione S-transferase